MTILPCPFCGSEELIVCTGTDDREGVPVSVRCDLCGAQGPWQYVPDSTFTILENVVEVTEWNKRTTELRIKELQKQIEELSKINEMYRVMPSEKVEQLLGQRITKNLGE